MVLPARALALGLLTLVLAWHGAGAPLERPDECCCEESAPAAALSVDDAGAVHAHETCPPGCEDCPCCGGVAMIATLSSSAVSKVPVRPVTTTRQMEEDAPSGEPSGVFRPPRA